MNNKAQEGWIILIVLGVLTALIIGAFLLFPVYNVWAQSLAGKADLREAEWNRQIAELDAKAEVERAKGVAEANVIIAKSLDEQYLRYLWIQGLHDGTSETIYIPTEANLPILEANRR